MPQNTVPRDRLGLALAGGGFRASLFHVGVLHRLADIDILRYVEVISGVSGGSITAALYALYLKGELEKHGDHATLPAQTYKNIVCALESKLRGAIRKNLRTRLLMCPSRLFRVLVSRKNLSNEMACLYHEHLFGGILLQKIVPQWAEKMTDSERDEYNGEEVEKFKNPPEKRGSVLTKLILNATTVNTGKRFWFSDSELGESHYGYIHKADISCLKERKKQIKDHLAGKKGTSAGESVLEWVINGKSFPAAYDALRASAVKCGIELECLRTADLKMLRYLRNWLQQITDDASLVDRYLPDIAWALSIVGKNYFPDARKWLKMLPRKAGKNTNPDLWEDLCRFVQDVYLYRSAINVRDSIDADWNSLTLAQAVAASANFPPLFAPYQEERFYDDLVVGRFGLTDGGVYDNMGIDGLFGLDCNYVICSDTGSPPAKYRPISGGRLDMLLGIANIFRKYNYVAKSDRLHEAHRISEGLSRLSGACQAPLPSRIVDELHAPRELHGFAQFSINSSDDTEDDLANLRTDLDAFNAVEMNALIRRGYEFCKENYERWLNFKDSHPAYPNGVPEHILARYGTIDRYPYKALDQTGKPECAGPPYTLPKDWDIVIKAGASRFFRLFRFFWKRYLVVRIIIVPGAAVLLLAVLAAIYLFLICFTKMQGWVTSVPWPYPLFTALSFLLAMLLPKLLFSAAAWVKRSNIWPPFADRIAWCSLRVRIVFGWLAASFCGAWILGALTKHEKFGSTLIGSFVNDRMHGGCIDLLCMIPIGLAAAVAVAFLASLVVSVFAWISYVLSWIYLRIIDGIASTGKTDKGGDAHGTA